MSRHPRESGGPLLVRNTMDSRIRGNDVIFKGLGTRLSVPLIGSGAKYRRIRA
jgi:hypothetical protein